MHFYCHKSCKSEEWLMNQQQMFTFLKSNRSPGNMFTCFMSLFSSTICESEQICNNSAGGCLKYSPDMITSTAVSSFSMSFYVACHLNNVHFNVQKTMLQLFQTFKLLNCINWYSCIRSTFVTVVWIVFTHWRIKILEYLLVHCLSIRWGHFLLQNWITLQFCHKPSYTLQQTPYCFRLKLNV